MTRAPPGAHRPTHISLECAIRAQVLHKKVKQAYKMVSCLLTVTQSKSGTSTARTDRRPSDGRDPFIALKALHGTFTCEVLYGCRVNKVLGKTQRTWHEDGRQQLYRDSRKAGSSLAVPSNNWNITHMPSVLNTSRSGRPTGHKFPPWHRGPSSLYKCVCLINRRTSKWHVATQKVN